jgi:hypothetical protein
MGEYTRLSFKDIGWEGINWLCLSQGSNQWQAYANQWVPQNAGDL